MDDYGRLLPAENRFPSAAGGKGFKPLSNYVHSLGLKFGIHIMRGLPRAAAHRRLPVLGTQFTCADAADPIPSARGTPICTGYGPILNKAGLITKASFSYTRPGTWIL